MKELSLTTDFASFRRRNVETSAFLESDRNLFRPSVVNKAPLLSNENLEFGGKRGIPILNDGDNLFVGDRLYGNSNSSIRLFSLVIMPITSLAGLPSRLSSLP